MSTKGREIMHVITNGSWCSRDIPNREIPQWLKFKILNIPQNRYRFFSFSGLNGDSSPRKIILCKSVDWEETHKSHFLPNYKIEFNF